MKNDQQNDRYERMIKKFMDILYTEAGSVDITELLEFKERINELEREKDNLENAYRKIESKFMQKYDINFTEILSFRIALSVHGLKKLIEESKKSDKGG